MCCYCCPACDKSAGSLLLLVTGATSASVSCLLISKTGLQASRVSARVSGFLTERRFLKSDCAY